VANAEHFIPVYVDFFSNDARHPEGKEHAKEHHRRRIEANLDAIVAREAELPVLEVHCDSEASELVIGLLQEARHLFCLGHYCSCVAMCGIVADWIVKDIFRHSVVIRTDAGYARPSERAFDQLERIDIDSLTKFAAECSLITPDVKSAAKYLVELRNQYAHARGKDREADALKAIACLHRTVDGTLSVLEDFDLEDGRLVPRPADTTGSTKAD